MSLKSNVSRDQATVLTLLTGAIVNVDIIAQILQIVMCGCPNETPKGFRIPGGCCVWYISRVFQCLVCSVEEDTLLGVHTLSLARTNLEKSRSNVHSANKIMALVAFNLLVVKLVCAIDEVARMFLHRRLVLRAIVIRHLETVFWNLKYTWLKFELSTASG